MTERNEKLPLHTKYRPQTFEEVIGNETVIKSLQSVLQREKGQVRSFLFSGPTGSGKTTLARIIAKELDCSGHDFYEYNSANTRGIDTIRDIISSSALSPMTGKIKIYLLDEAHKISADGQGALLKLLEDTPQHIRIILCTTDPEKLLEAIRGRCSIFSVKSLRKNEILQLLKWVLNGEGIAEGGFPETTLFKIAECCNGCPRQALVLLDSIIDIEDEKDMLDTIIKIAAEQQTAIDLCTALLTTKNWEKIGKIISSIDGEPEKLRYAVLTYMGKVLLSKPNDRAASIIELFSSSFIYSGKAGLTLACYLITKL